jgi:hypothetical protein
MQAPKRKDDDENEDHGYEYLDGDCVLGCEAGAHGRCRPLGHPDYARHTHLSYAAPQAEGPVCDQVCS